MISFSNITIEEFIRLNADILPTDVLNCIAGFSKKISELEEEVEQLRRSDELAWEQVEFARELIQQIDNFAEKTLTKRELRDYNQLRENSYFEV